VNRKEGLENATLPEDVSFLPLDGLTVADAFALGLGFASSLSSFDQDPSALTLALGGGLPPGSLFVLDDPSLTTLEPSPASSPRRPGSKQELLDLLNRPSSSTSSSTSTPDSAPGGAASALRKQRVLFAFGGRGNGKPRDVERLVLGPLVGGGEGTAAAVANGVAARNRGSSSPQEDPLPHPPHWERVPAPGGPAKPARTSLAGATSSAPAAPLTWSHVDFATAAAPEGIYLLGGSVELAPTASATRFDPRTSTFTALRPLPLAAAQGAAAYLSGPGVVAFTGGWRAGGQPVASVGLRRVDAYDPGSDTWTAWPPMAFERVRHAVAASASGQVLYALGGEEPSSGRVLSVAEFYDVRTPSWQLLPPLSIERACFGAAIDSMGRLYAVGGDRGGGLPMRACERLDLRMCPVRSASAEGAAGGQAYPAAGGGRGGAPGASSVWGWERIADMAHKRRGHAVCSSVPANFAAAVAGQGEGAQQQPWVASSGGAAGREGGEYIYALGGLAKWWGNRRDVERYDVRAEAWEEAPDMCAERALHGAACYAV
jgi:hypothetical protein